MEVTKWYLDLIMKLFRNRKLCGKSCVAFLILNTLFVVVIFISSVKHTNHLSRLKELRLSESASLRREALKLISDPVKQKEMRQGEHDTIILFWTTYFSQDIWKEPAFANLNRTRTRCFDNCRLVTDRKYSVISDAVIFHSKDMRVNDFPIVRPMDQIWVYMNQESPFHTQALEKFNITFNWTMTYRRDSDVYHPYFLTVPHHNSSGSTINHSETATQKTKLVAWIVSNCHTPSKRENFVHQLQTYIPVDTYGRCGDFTCHRSGDYGCLPEIAPSYKFYLAFENSICKDYITEKFSRALQHNLVPIVYGGGDYSTVGPPKSYINALDFPSPKALADYLLLLDKRPDLYAEYFQWKTKYKIIETESSFDGWCNLCRKLRKKQATLQERKSYYNLSQWWYSTSDGSHICVQPTDSMLEKWKLVGLADLVTFVRRWFYKTVLGY